MPVLKLYPNGLTGGVRPHTRKKKEEEKEEEKEEKPSPRDECKGWSLKSSRSNTRFLYSVQAGDLPRTTPGKPPREGAPVPAEPLVGLALSLTVRDCPPTHEEWKDLCHNLFKRLRRKGLYRLHWLTEWQRRGVPHLHAAVWFRLADLLALGRKMGLDVSTPLLVSSLIACLVTSDWLQVSAPFRSVTQSQHVKPITGELGWLQYLSKHASRGAAHYQRALGTIPTGWQKTGRMWGHIGEWPTCEPLALELHMQDWYSFRRIVRAWRLAQARQQGGSRRIRSARRMLQCADPALSRVRGVSEWIDLELGKRITDWLKADELKREKDLDDWGKMLGLWADPIRCTYNHLIFMNLTHTRWFDSSCG